MIVDPHMTQKLKNIEKQATQNKFLHFPTCAFLYKVKKKGICGGTQQD
jgi:hypothetical protein